MEYESSLIEEVAYAMQLAYTETTGQIQATAEVEGQYPDFDVMVIFAMWKAIDAYVDING